MSRSSDYDVCCGLENLPVSIESTSHEEQLPRFQYSPDNVPGPGSDIDPSEVTFPGCDCNSASCHPGICSCLQSHGQMYNDTLCLRVQDEKDSGCCRPVFECNIMCRCSEACANRVVQRGLGFRLQVFRTEGKGWGLQTLEPVPKGRFVCEYAGEVIGFAEACSRQRSQKLGDMNYIIAVREHASGGGRVVETFIDPARVGNIGRFLNHSCQPNLLMVPVRVDSLVPRLALFAARDIALGEELVYDYSGSYKNSRCESQVVIISNTDSLSKKPCYCGAKECSRFLPLDVSIINHI